MNIVNTYYLSKLVQILSEGYNYIVLKEAVSYSVSKEYLKIERSPEAESRVKSIFGKLKSLPNASQLDKRGWRIAFPYAEDSTEFEIQSILEPYDFSIKNYKDGLALDTKSNKEIAIGKALNKISKKEPDAKELLDRYAAIKGKGATNKDEDLMIVFSSAKYDIIGMSTGREWRSCMNVIDGGNKNYVKLDIKEGSIVCYLTTIGDTNLKKPLGRVLIKPYLNTENKEDVILYAELRTYGSIPNPDKFMDEIDDYMEKTQKLFGTYKRLGCLYNDSERDSVEDKETIQKRAFTKLKDDRILSKEEFIALPLKNKRQYIDKTLTEKYIRLENYEYSFASQSQKKEYIEKRVKSAYDLTDQQYKDASDNLKKLYIEKLIGRGFNLSEQQYEHSPDNLKQFYVENKVRKGLELSDEQYKNASDITKELYIENIFFDEKNNYDLSNQQYKDTPNDLKQLYIKKSIEKGSIISNQQYEDSPNDLKQLYIKQAIENGYRLSDQQYKDAPINLKKLYIEERVGEYYAISDQQYNDTPNNIKQFFIKKRIEIGYELSNEPYKDAPNDLKQLYIEKILEKGYELSNEQYENSPNDLKQLYIRKLIEKGNSITYQQYEDASDNLKQLHIKQLIEKGYKLPDQFYEEASDNLKQVYIEKIVALGIKLSNKNYKNTSNKLKKLYIEKIVEFEHELSDQQYEDTPNDLKEYYLKLKKWN